MKVQDRHYNLLISIGNRPYLSAKPFPFALRRLIDEGLVESRQLYCGVDNKYVPIFSVRLTTLGENIYKELKDGG